MRYIINEAKEIRNDPRGNSRFDIRGCDDCKYQICVPVYPMGGEDDVRIPDVVKYFIAVFILTLAAILFVLGTMWAAIYYGGIILLSVWTAFMFSVIIVAAASMDQQ